MLKKLLTNSMISPAEIIENAKGHLREIAGDSIAILKKGNDKLVAKMDEIESKKGEMYRNKENNRKDSQQAILSQIKGVENAVKAQKEVESVSINNPEAITGDLKTGLQGIITALQTELKNFDKNIVVKNDFSNFASLFKSSQDKKSIIEALKKIEDKLDRPEKEEKEDIDYTMILSDIASAVEDKEAIGVLNKILDKELNVTLPGIMDVNLDPSLIEDKRIRTVLPEEQVERMSKLIAGGDNKSVILTDSSGNKVKVSDDGQLHTIMEGRIDEGNSTETPLLANAKFTGVGTDILGYSAIAILLKADQVSADSGLEIQFSQDNTNWHNGEHYTYATADSTKFFTPPTQAKYFRLEYTNGTVDQTYLHLHVTLKKSPIKWSSHNIDDPIKGEDDAELNKSVLTGINQDGDFVNIESTYANSLKSSIYDGETGRRAEVESLGALKVETPIRLVGTTFSNGTKDPNFWTETVTGTGSVTQAGEILLETGITANSTAKYETVRKARKITGTTNQFRAVARNVETPADDCIRRIGAYDTNDGFFMQFAGTVFGVASRKNGVDTVVTNGNFNGNGGATIAFGGGTDFSRTVIEYTALSAKYFINGTLIHTIMPTTESLTNTLNLKVTMEIINEDGNTDDNSYEILFATILRLGELETEAEYKYIGTNTTTVCKYNAGRLKRILNVDNAGDVEVYDNTVGSGTTMAIIDTAKALGTLEFDIPFSNGLTVVTSGGAKVVVVYE